MIGVCIKYFHENYGGMLQAFATTQYLEDNGYNYELIQYKKKKNIVFVVKSLPRLFNFVLLNDKFEMIKKKIGALTHPEYVKNDAIRMCEFDSFRKKHFTKLSQEYVGYDALCAGAEKYCAVITGSDQLWSPAGLPTNYYNLQFVPEGITKISIASSFGVKEIPWYQKKRTKKYLERIEHISMREDRGAEIVKELTGREVPVILDPVFLLSRDEWLKKIPQQNLLEEPYILAYFLGASQEHRLAVTELSKKLGLKIVALRHLDQYVDTDETFGDIAPYDVGPEQFLNMIRNAAYVCTDSFHGTAFSIINEKQVIIFDRYKANSVVSKNSRIDTLCNNLGLQNRRYGVDNRDIVAIANRNIDYALVNAKMDQQRRDTDKYMKKVFNAIRSDG